MAIKRISINDTEFTYDVQQGISGGKPVTYRSYWIRTATSLRHVTREEFCDCLHQKITSTYPELWLELDEGRRRYASKKPVNG